MPASFMGLPAEIRVHIIDAIDSLSDVLRCRVVSIGMSPVLRI
jgi:hypothetical protein